MAASGAKYGMLTCHFYWIGAIPAMVFLGIFMMPFYYGSKARSVPEYLKLRFDEKTRAFNAISFAVMTIFTSGISLYILALIISPIIGVSFSLALLISAVIVLVYIYLGGLTSAIYNEVLQFFLIVLGFLPVVLLGLRDMGGWHGLVDKINGLVTNPNNLDALHRLGHDHAFPAGTWTNAWTPLLGPIKDNPMGIDLMGMVMGLGFVLSFGYWCTNFLVVQRAMAANSMSSARRTPLIGAIPKMLFPVLVILPGLIAVVAGTQLSGKDKDTRKVATLLDEATATFGQGVIPPKTKDLSEYTAEEQKKIPHGDITTKISGGKPVKCVVQRGDDGKVEARLQHGHGQPAGLLLPDGAAGPGPDGAVGLLHVGDGRQRHRLQLRLDLRHLPELLCAEPARCPLPLDGQGGHALRHPGQHRRRLPGSCSSTTSWTPSNWSSASSMPRCSPPSSWACSGSGPPVTAPFGAWCWGR